MFVETNSPLANGEALMSIANNGLRGIDFGTLKNNINRKQFSG